MLFRYEKMLNKDQAANKHASNEQCSDEVNKRNVITRRFQENMGRTKAGVDRVLLEPHPGALPEERK